MTLAVAGMLDHFGRSDIQEAGHDLIVGRHLVHVDQDLTMAFPHHPPGDTGHDDQADIAQPAEAMQDARDPGRCDADKGDGQQ